MVATSMLALTPEAKASGAGASTDTTTTDTTTSSSTIRNVSGATFVEDPDRPFDPAQQAANTAFARITARAVCDYDPGPVPLPADVREREHARVHDHSRDYERWLSHVSPAGGCAHPVQLTGTATTVDTSTGEIRESRHTSGMPDGVIYTACGNRRATVCPSCAETYRADTYHLVLAGLRGGKSVPETVRKHMAAFVTFTAPSFGLVHSRWAKKGAPAKVCRPRRKPDLCPHGVDRRCFQKHGEGERALGKPLCLDCYDHAHQVVWNVMAGELWRRTTDKIKTGLTAWARAHGTKLRLSYAKVAELQARGVAHFHALVRLDGLDLADLDRIVPPCEHADFGVLEDAIRAAVEGTSFVSPPHPDRRDGWEIGWGSQLDIRPVRLAADGAVTETHVAGYLAKYATKATEDAGHVSARITADTIRMHTSRDGHVPRLLKACWRLGRRGCDLDPAQASKNSGRLSYRRLRRWAHMLGFGGHFSTKSRRYSTTLRALREARVAWRRQHHRTAEHTGADETTLIVGHYVYADTGWHTTGDALLANTSAAKAREHRRVGKEEHAHLEHLDLI